jgi:hypothetical protein
MEIGLSDDGDEGHLGHSDEEGIKKLRDLPDDLPKSLNDRRSFPAHFPVETEIYDAWQGV